MVDSGATHNFISRRLVVALGLPVSSFAGIHITLGDGYSIFVTEQCLQIPVSIGSFQFLLDVLVFDTGNLDLILGMAWLASLGEVVHNWHHSWMQFQIAGKEVRLQGVSHNQSKSAALQQWLGRLDCCDSELAVPSVGDSTLSDLQQQVLSRLLHEVSDVATVLDRSHTRPNTVVPGVAAAAAGFRSSVNSCLIRVLLLLFKESSVIQKDYVEFEDETLDKSGESVTPEVVFDSGSTGVDTDDDSVSGSTGNNSESNDSGSNGSESSEEEEDSTSSVQSSSIPGSYVPQPETQHWVRRSTRVTVPPDKYSPSANFLLLSENGEPDCYTEAVSVKDSFQWEIAMKEEMKSLEKNITWVLTKLPSGKKALQNKWVYRIKDESDGSKRYKARLVVKGFQQKEGVDSNEIFSRVVKMTTIRLVLSIVASENLHLEQLDVKTAFLHGDLDEDIYMVQPEGFQISGKENMVCKLKKSLYGLKQAPRQWYLKFDNFMGRNGFKRCEMDHCCYIKKFSKSYIILLLYVDDMLIAGSDMKEINKLKKQMSEEFEMKDLGAAKQILGMSIFRNSKDLKRNI
ncbi:hypothetical protein E3N88_45129 [Mikania micrantha]|uniref:Reverse transcriptase Ty1/copia-type domain-containing protein n=1 Tax=Mikania micrantha TaxID=192012 RepID=A0A5N6LAA6_9ASTR|nr:hypothetical protein E3N88_45129 [Mikania micrantha]